MAELTAADVRQILEFIDQSHFEFFELRMGDLHLTVSKTGRGLAAPASTAPAAPAPAASTAPFAPAAPAAPEAPAAPGAAGAAAARAAPADPAAPVAQAASVDPAAPGAPVAQAAPADPAAPRAPAAPADTAALAREPASGGAGDLFSVTAPIVGAFYAHPEPGAPPFVQLGSRVEADSTLGLIEVMKVFNAVTAGVRGQIAEILVTNTQFVEYGQVLFRIRADAAGAPQ